jgi:ferric-dicitrate binding protein FerR (iron transport regulator)
MPERMWEPLGRKIDPRWGSERERSVRVAIERRGARRRAAMRAVASVAALAAVAGGLYALRGARAHAPGALASPTATPPAVAATVVVTQLLPETIVEPMTDPRGRGYVLRSGGARFVAPHEPDHPLLIVAGDVTVEDLGTTFTVQYVSAESLSVAVEEGRVRVHAPGADTDVIAGERAQFAVHSSSPSEERRPATGVAAPSWRVLAESGRYDEAHTALRRAGPNAVRDETADLLLAADAARLSGHPAAAVPYLERVVRSHSTDPRSSLASFTLGRVLLEELGRPGEAADAFARARGAGGPLAEDALAREVEATARAGDTSRSRDLAREYQALYPNGRRAKAVSKFSGLD